MTSSTHSWPAPKERTGPTTTVPVIRWSKPPSSATSQPRSVPGRSQEAPGVEQGAWLAAITQDQADRDRTLRDLLGNLEAKLASMPRGGP